MDEFCVICLGNFKNKIKIACGHEFCFLCIKGVKLSGYEEKCPVCRANLPDLDHLKLEKKDETNVDYEWLYSGKTNGWWKFDEDSNLKLEEMYQKYLLNNDSDSEDDEKNLLRIGSLKFDIDFANMLQVNHDTGAKRKIKRIVKEEEIKENIKGISGLYL